MSFSSFILGVARIGQGLLNEYLKKDFRQNDTNKIAKFEFGDLIWTQELGSSEINVYNKGKTESVIVMTKHKYDGAVLSLTQPLPPGKAVEIAKDLEAFGSGQMSVTPNEEIEDSANPSQFTKNITYGVISVISTKFLVTNGITFERRENFFRIQTENFLNNATIRYENRNGERVELTGRGDPNQRTDESNSKDYIIDIPFPKNVNTELPLNSFNLILEINVEQYKKITDKMRNKIKDINEVPSLQKLSQLGLL